MLVELIIFFEIIVFVLFLVSFFTKNELLWGLTSVFSGIMVFASFNLEKYVYVCNNSSSTCKIYSIAHSNNFLILINLIFFVVVIILLMLDLFNKCDKIIGNKNIEKSKKVYSENSNRVVEYKRGKYRENKPKDFKKIYSKKSNREVNYTRGSYKKHK